MIRHFPFFAVLATLVATNGASAHEDGHHDTPMISQYGLPLTLMNTIYEGTITAREMKKQGTIGVGVSNQLNGELTVVDGVVYQIAADGTSTVAPDELQAPYISMIDFRPDRTVTIADVTSFKDLSDKLSRNYGAVNSFYAFRATGLFDHVKMASAHAVEDGDTDFFAYLDSRQMYSVDRTDGTMVGIFTPEYLATVSIPGLHFHFQTADNKTGGHVEDVRFDSMVFEVQQLDRIDVSLPMVDEFRTEPMQMIAPPSGAGAGGAE
ncbi:acetolactate decarboxylase [Paracoccus sp. Z330]|uniref:Alpha-acetolactate decarboxylase n=1 Tax=Paracoccus onchidii TaxID=3017813 RepID=A0ABT4ZAK5_9RHOB|nr:acetolactate decarboxylase [Paracoccus onchidii]MDB6176314.1 acetolactate decarboxylase [Paracoccus onchidii]